MGNKAQVEQERISIREWKLVQNSRGFNVWENKRNRNWHLQEYPIMVQGQQALARQIDVYNFRKNRKDIVETYYSSLQNNNEVCCSSISSPSIFTERIPIRLDQLQHIPWPDYLHLYERSIRGYYELSKRFGYFQVEDYMIGINQQHEVKVWINENFGKSSIGTIQITQQAMIRKILQVLEKSSDQDPSLPRLNEYVRTNADKMSFENVMSSIKKYAQTYNNGWIPVQLSCVNAAGGVYAIISHLIGQQSTKGFLKTKQNYTIKDKTQQRPNTNILFSSNNEASSSGMQQGIIINKRIDKVKNNQLKLKSKYVESNNVGLQNSQQKGWVGYYHESNVRQKYEAEVHVNGPPKATVAYSQSLINQMNNKNSVLHIDSRIKHQVNSQFNTPVNPQIPHFNPYFNPQVNAQNINRQNINPDNIIINKMPNSLAITSQKHTVAMPQTIQKIKVITQKQSTINAPPQNLPKKIQQISISSIPLNIPNGLPIVYEDRVQLQATPMKIDPFLSNQCQDSIIKPNPFDSNIQVSTFSQNISSAKTSTLNKSSLVKRSSLNAPMFIVQTVGKTFVPIKQSTLVESIVLTNKPEKIKDKKKKKRKTEKIEKIQTQQTILSLNLQKIQQQAQAPTPKKISKIDINPNT